MGFEEFSDPALAGLYDTVCPLSDDSAFHLALASELGAERVLDVGCGTGSLSVELARAGRHVTAVEPAAAMLAIAQSRSGTELVRWVHGGADAVDDAGFDLAVMTAHVAQVITDDEVLRVTFAAIAQRLADGGHLVFDSRNPNLRDRGWAEAFGQMRRFEDPQQGAFALRIEMIGTEGKLSHYDLHYEFDDGRRLVSHNTLAFRSREELTAMLEVAGLTVERVWGDWDRSEALPDSPEMIFLAVRPGSQEGERP